MNKQQKIIIALMSIFLFLCVLTLISYSNKKASSNNQLNYEIAALNYESQTPEKTSEPTERVIKNVYFTNKFGTATTICNHDGCSNYIASSGDTNCCTIHSNKCLECGCYIDEDAAWCISCLTKAIEEISNN